MIDLSHLTEEEQGMIMTVLRRDAELKKAEEERIRKLEKILNSGSQSEGKLKYLTGEWFYEAKSRRHMDKIHGSEIILASMKQRRDASPRVEKSSAPSSRGSDIVAPPKPARCFNTLLQPQQINDAVKENRNSDARSPRTPRHNPFNRASLIVVEPPENNDDVSASQDHESSETESSLKNHATGENVQTSDGSIRSESSSLGFKPVPKKRTFLSRRHCGQSESDGLGLDAQVGAAGIVPAPRRNLRRGSSGSSNQSCLKSQDEMPPKSADLALNLVSHISAGDTSCLGNVSQVPFNSSLDADGDPSATTRDRPATYVRGHVSPEREAPHRSDEGDVQTHGEQAGMNTVVMHTGSIQDSDRANTSSEGTSMRQEDLSLTQNTQDPDPPVSYDLNFIDKSDEQAQRKSGQKHAFKLSTQASSPTGDEDSIAKVLDWFSRSTDSNDLLAEDGPAATRSSVDNNKLRSEESIRKDAGDLTERKDAPDIKRNHFETNTKDAKELRGTDKMDDKELSEVRNEAQKDTRERMNLRDLNHDDSETPSPKISNLKSFWEKNDQGPKILVRNEVQRPKVIAEKEEGNKPHTASNMNSAPGIYNGRGIHDKYASKHGVERDQQLVISPYKAVGDSVHVNNNHSVDPLVMDTVSQKNNNDPTYISNYLKLLESDRDIESRLSPESETVSSLKPDGVARSRENPVQVASQPDTDVQKRVHRGSSEEVKRRDSEDRNMSPRRKEDPSNKDRGNTAEKIKQLKSFWEQERNKSIFYSPNSPADGRVMVRGTNQEKLTKRFTKSEYDLRSAGNNSGSDEEDANRNHHNFTVLPLSQRMEKLSPSLSTSRTQFSTLREFWDEAVSDSFSSDKPKSPRRKEPLSPKHPCQEYKYGDSEMNRSPPAGEKTRPHVMKSPPSPQSRSKSSQDRQTGPTSRVVTDSKNNLTAESRDAGREEKSTKTQNNAGKETRSPKSRSNNHGNSLRRVTSMFTLSVSDDKDQEELNVDVSPIHFQNRKQRQNAVKGAMPRRPSEGTETPTLARAFVPRDYRHYLGMTDKTSVHTSFAPAMKGDGSEGKSGFDFDMGGPVRTSTPVSSEERYSRQDNKMSQCPLWANYSSSDTGQESSLSSTSETWSTSRNSSNRENDYDTHHPVKKALRRAEARPKHLAKSIEDITNASSPRQERDQDSAAEIGRIRDDPDHLKKLSKSVPSFLEKEDDSNDVDSTFGDSFGRGRLMMGSSMTNLTSSSGVASRSGSVMTMYSMDFGNVEVQGNIQFSINYVQKLREFHIFVAECRDLAAVDPKRGRSDPYVKSYLVPDKANLGKRKTSVKKKTLNPTFNEILRYRVRIDYLRAQTLILSVWHHDTFGRNSFLGEVDVDLSKWDFDHTQMNYLALKARSTPTLAPANGRGEMRLAIRFLPQVTHSEGVGKDGPNSGEVHIWVKECKNLPLIRATIDPYVKCFVLPDTSRKSRQKTRVLRRTADPVFNHTMVYDGISETDLTEACVELTVWDRDRLASNLLGGLRLGLGTGKSYGAAVDWMDSSPCEVALWERMMASPDQWVEDVLPLRMVNSAKTAFK